MSKINLGIVGILVLIGIAVLAAKEHQAQVRLRVANESLQEELAQLSRASADNQRLSNVVAEAKVALARSDERFQELLKLRAEVSRLNQEKQDAIRGDQAKTVQSASDSLRELTAFRSEVKGLTKEITTLRGEIRQFAAGAPVSAPVETAVERAADKSVEKPIEQARSTEDQAMAVRMIDTQGEPFAEKLKRSVAAQEGETFQEVFGRFLQVNGIDTTTVAGSGYNERTGKVIVRATQPTLDQIEKIVVALDRAQ